MRYLRKYLLRVGLVSTLLIGGVVGGLMASVPSEAASLSIDGVDIPLLDTIGTGEGNKYTCESGYNSCWYITSSTTATRTTGTWTVANVSTTNRARVRINDVGGTPATNVDKMNLTGTILTPPANTDGKTTHIIITHTYSNGQGSGDYLWGMGATGYFDPAGTDTVLNNKFVLTGKGKFYTPTATDATGATDPEVSIGRLDKGPFKSPLAPGANGIVTQTVAVTTVKTGCNTNGSGFCKPTITYDFEVTVVGADALTLTDSIITAGITCTVAQLDPLIPPLLLYLMKLIDPTGPLPTHISGLNAWIDQMAVKYKLNPTQLAKVANLKIALGKWLLGQTCAGKPQVVINTDSVTGVNGGLTAGGILVTTCVDTNTCGTITITKNTRNALGFLLQTSDTFTFNVTGPSLLTEMISMGGQNSQSKTVTVESGPYSITEGELSGWTLNSSSCGLNVYVPVGGNVSCTFNNNKAFSRDDYRVVLFSSSDMKTWSAARTAAQAIAPGGSWDLASITSADEQAFIQTLLPPNPLEISGVHDYWIGGRQFGESEPGGDWRWDRDNVQFYNGASIPGVYSNWGTGEPNNVGGSENHLTVDNRFGWGWNDLNTDGATEFPKGYIAKRFPSP